MEILLHIKKKSLLRFTFSLHQGLGLGFRASGLGIRGVEKSVKMVEKKIQWLKKSIVATAKKVQSIKIILTFNLSQDYKSGSSLSNSLLSLVGCCLQRLQLTRGLPVYFLACLTSQTLKPFSRATPSA